MAKNNPPSAASATVRVYNQGKASFMHGEHRIGPGEFAEVPKDVAEVWMSHKAFGMQIVIPADDVKIRGTDSKVKALETEKNTLQQRCDGLEKLIANFKTEALANYKGEGLPKDMPESLKQLFNAVLDPKPAPPAP